MKVKLCTGSVAHLVCLQSDWHFAANPAAYNRSSRDHYSKYYDDELRGSVRARFSAEIGRFGRAFERK